MKKIFRIMILCLCVLSVFGCSTPDDTGNESSSVKYIEIEYKGLIFEIPESWKDLEEDFVTGKAYVFTDYKDRESIEYYSGKATKGPNASLEGKDLLESICNDFIEEYNVLSVNYDTIGSHATVLFEYTYKESNGQTQTNTAFYVSLDIGEVAMFFYGYDEGVTPEHQSDYEHLIESIRIIE